MTLDNPFTSGVSRNWLVRQRNFPVPRLSFHDKCLMPTSPVYFVPWLKIEFIFVAYLLSDFHPILSKQQYPAQRNKVKKPALLTHHGEIAPSVRAYVISHHYPS
jgi:hypothetical protein